MSKLFESAAGLSSAMSKGTLSAAELMQSTLARIAAVNPAVNAVVSLRPPDALIAEARAADQMPKDQRGPLFGLPIAIKDLANAKGLPTSHGSPILPVKFPKVFEHISLIF